MKSKDNLANKQKSQEEEREEELVRKHYGLAVSQALYFLNDPNFEDYIQAGLIGLLKAVRNHDENKSKFSTFATVCVRNEIQSLDKKAKKYKSRNYRNVTEQDRHYNTEETLSDCLPEFLEEEYKFIISLKIQNYTNAEISDFISCSKKEVKEKIELIIILLKEYNV
mgnify:FL=1|tara:strand:- start:3390 stop:3890 length:501 start_codon:yes stop_codon:yes gene_type:complete